MSCHMLRSRANPWSWYQSNILESSSWEFLSNWCIITTVFTKQTDQFHHKEQVSESFGQWKFLASRCRRKFGYASRVVPLAFSFRGYIIIMHISFLYPLFLSFSCSYLLKFLSPETGISTIVSSILVLPLRRQVGWRIHQPKLKSSIKYKYLHKLFLPIFYPTQCHSHASRSSGKPSPRAGCWNTPPKMGLWTCSIGKIGGRMGRDRKTRMRWRDVGGGVRRPGVISLDFKSVVKGW